MLNNAGNLLLHEACMANESSLDALIFLIERNPASAHKRGQKGRFPLHLALVQPSQEVIELLLRKWPEAVDEAAPSGAIRFILQ